MSVGLPNLGPDGLPPGSRLDPDWEVSPREVRDVMAAPGDAAAKPLLLDCRRQDEWQTCRIDGSVLFPMESIAAQLDQIEDAAGSRERPIIVYCHHGRRSLRVAAELRRAGFADVKSMAGGIDLWSMDIDPAVPRY